jgi:archaeoflavoprotein AfpA
MAEKKRKVAWGISGSGDKLAETIHVMKKIVEQYQGEVEIKVFLSKAGEHVAKWYGFVDELKGNFGGLLVETNSNVPFLAGQLQTRQFEFLLIAPATSNTVAKISLGIADSLLSNSAIMALKGFVPVYILPSDYKEGTILTKLPGGEQAKLRVRKEDVKNVDRLRRMENVFVFETPEEILRIFKKHLGAKRLKFQESIRARKKK